jgi:hypothetical protein
LLQVSICPSGLSSLKGTSTHPPCYLFLSHGSYSDSVSLILSSTLIPSKQNGYHSLKSLILTGDASSCSSLGQRPTQAVFPLLAPTWTTESARVFTYNAPLKKCTNTHFTLHRIPWCIAVFIVILIRGSGTFWFFMQIGTG